MSGVVPDPAQAAWLAYRDQYGRTNYLNRRQVASQLRRREFIAGYLAAINQETTTTPTPGGTE